MWVRVVTLGYMVIVQIEATKMMLKQTLVTNWILIITQIRFKADSHKVVLQQR